MTSFARNIGSGLVNKITSLTKKEILDEYDYVVIGGGTAGCVVAARLSENPEVSVLVLEAGPDDAEIPAVRVPWHAFDLLNSDVDWGRKTIPQKDACLALENQQSLWGLGKMLGGCFSHNAMHYVRGNAGDYDYWCNELGLEGWDYKNVLEYFKKSEDIQVPAAEKEFHGTGGEFMVTEPEIEELSGIGKGFLDGLNSLGIPIGDYNGSSQLRCSRIPQLLNKSKGERWSSVDALIRPNKNRQNLTVVCDAMVTKILLNDSSNRAVGVEFDHGKQNKMSSRSVKVRREAIVCAGAVHSPQILMVSGIGPKNHLEEHGIACKVDSPAVGENLQDHIHIPIEFQSKVPTKNSDVVETKENLDRWNRDGSGPLGVNSWNLEATGFTITGERPDLAKFGQPDIQLYCWPKGAGASKEVDESGQVDMFGVTHEFTRKDFSYDWLPNQFTIIATLLHPKSIGYVKLQSNNIYDSPLIDPKYIEDEADVRSLKAGWKKLLELMNTQHMKAVTGPPTPQPHCPYEFGTDEHIEWTIRHYTYTGYHWVGTCAMGVDTKTSVLDAQLRVHQVPNLRVVDGASIPQIPSGNTCAPILMVAEKASDMIKETLAKQSKL